MASRRRRLLLLALAVAGCRHDVARLDDVQKMAYGAKPAVVRVNAYATADFRYTMRSITSIARSIGLTRDFEAADAVVHTGAGGSGTGFIINTGGRVLT